MAIPKLHTVGRRMLNQIINGATARPTTVYLLLRQLDGNASRPTDAADGDTLTTNLNEVVGAGYARIAIVLNSTNAPETLTGVDSILTFAQQQFNFTGTFSGITHMAIATTADNTGILLWSAPLSAVRNVANGDQLKVTPTFTMQTG